MKKLRNVAWVLASAVALGSCTYVPTDSQPQVVNVHNVPFNLLNRHPVAPTPRTGVTTPR